MPRNFINWSCKLTPFQRERDGGGGQPPVKSEVRAQSNKVGRLWFFGGRCSRISGGTPEARSRLCVCRASFLMTFATGGAPHAGSRQKTISLSIFYRFQCTNIPPGFFLKQYVYMLLLMISNFKCTLFKYRKIIKFCILL